MTDNHFDIEGENVKILRKTEFKRKSMNANLQLRSENCNSFLYISKLKDVNNNLIS